MKTFKPLFIITLSILLSFLPITIYAHSGKTDYKGGHRDSKTGEYHYHHGYPEHQHEDMDGDGVLDCPYDFDDNVNNSNKNSGIIEKEKTLLGIYSIIGIILSITHLLMLFPVKLKRNKYKLTYKLILYILFFTVIAFLFCTGIFFMFVLIHSIVCAIFEDDFWLQQLLTNTFNFILIYRIIIEFKDRKSK